MHRDRRIDRLDPLFRNAERFDKIVSDELRNGDDPIRRLYHSTVFCAQCRVVSSLVQREDIVDREHGSDR